MPKPYQKTVYEKGNWIRTKDGNISEVIFMNTSTVHFNQKQSACSISFDQPAEGYLKRTENGWEIYVDSYIQKPVKLLKLNINRDGNTVLTYNAGKEGVKMLDGNGVIQSDLQPGQIYYFKK